MPAAEFRNPAGKLQYVMPKIMLRHFFMLFYATNKNLLCRVGTLRVAIPIIPYSQVRGLGLGCN